MTNTMRREMNIAAAMHYEDNVSAFARDFYALGKEHDKEYNAHSRIGMPVDIDH